MIRDRTVADVTGADSQRIVAGRYRIIRRLGNSYDAQGETHEAEDLHTKEIVAIKLLGEVPLGPWHEAQALTRLRDDHILPIRNADRASGQPYLVTALATHGTLGSRLADAGGIGIDPAVAVRWIRQACQGVARAHAEGLLHTDIKPDNLFLDENDNVQVGDFGLASLINEHGLGHTSGTHTVLAPEVAAAIVSKQATGTSVRSDVYSLGATLYELLSGQEAYSPPPGVGLGPGVNAKFIVKHRCAALRDVAPHVPRALADRVAKAMAADPATRYASAGEFAAALGSMPKPSRAWRRTDEHSVHHRCWRGVGSGADIVLCAAAEGGRWRLSATKQPSGRQIRKPAATVAVTAARLPASVRAAIKALD